jgi:hypothetical protein
MSSSRRPLKQPRDSTRVSWPTASEREYGSNRQRNGELELGEQVYGLAVMQTCVIAKGRQSVILHTGGTSRGGLNAKNGEILAIVFEIHTRVSTAAILIALILGGLVGLA